MLRTWTITLFKHEQPIESLWSEVTRFVTTWNDSHMPKFTKVMEIMWHINFDGSTVAAMKSLIQQLDQLKQDLNITYRVSSRGELEEDDYASADFIQIIGVNLGSELHPFLLNPEEAFGPVSPCVGCGLQDIFDVKQKAAFIIDETLLDQAVDDEAPLGKGGWDLVELATGQILVSQRLSDLLEHNEVDGYKLIEVINGATEQASKRIFQIIANKAVLTPCMEHSQIKGAPFCPSCGRARGDLEDYFWIRSDWIGDDEVISRHASGAAMLYLSRRIYQQLISNGFNGVHRNDVLFCCHHEKTVT